MTEERLALVTGASRGIGRSIAQALLEAGTRVVGTATSPKGLEAIRAIGDGEARVHPVQCDVRSNENIAELRQAIQDHFKRDPDILICNAGINQDNLVLRMKAEEWSGVLETNLTANFNVIQTFLRGMVKQRWGRIIAIGSVSSHLGNLGQANYAASKAGLEGFCRSLAREVASRGVTVNVVAPGFTKSDMTQILADDVTDAILQSIPMKRMADPEEIASPVCFLASESASYITGTTIHVNGGMLMT